MEKRGVPTEASTSAKTPTLQHSSTPIPITPKRYPPRGSGSVLVCRSVFKTDVPRQGLVGSIPTRSRHTCCEFISYAPLRFDCARRRNVMARMSIGNVEQRIAVILADSYCESHDS